MKIVSGDYLDTVTNLTIKYIEEVSDPKAQLITMYIGGGATGQVIVLLPIRESMLIVINFSPV